MNKLTGRELSELSYLAKQHQPIWGGHLKRGQPQNDLCMIRWLNAGLIEVVGDQGYRITPAGRLAISGKADSEKT